MKKIITLLALGLCLAMTTAAAAQDEEVDGLDDIEGGDALDESDPLEGDDILEAESEDGEIEEGGDVEAEADPDGRGYSMHVVGGTMNLGMAAMIVENCNNCSVRFAGGGNAHYNLYLARVFAIHVGIEFMGRGLKASGIANTTSQDEQKLMLIYLDIPIGIKLRFSAFQMALGASFDFALTGKWKNPDRDFQDADWDAWARRFNVGAWMSFGWAIHAGPIDIVPGFSWNMHILDENTSNSAFGFVRPFNLMFDVGVEFGI